MTEQSLQTHVLPNGLTLVLEPMDDVQSAAFTILVPGGSIYDPPGQNGSASVLCDLLVRGAGERDSQQLSNDLDNLGVQRHENVGTSHVAFTGATLADNLPDTLRIYGDIVQRPHLPAEQFPAAVAGVEQSLRALEDEPRQKVMLELRRRCFASPWGLPTEGSLAELGNLTAESVAAHYDRCFRANGSILGIAGRIDVERIKAVVEDVFGGFTVKPDPAIESGSRGPAVDHLHHDSAQTQIGIAYDSIPYSHPNYYAAWAAVGVLSGGMSARLFTEVREKRGLCYAVYATLNSLPNEGRVLCYAGTAVERAQETLDVTLRELQRLGDGIVQDELDRCKARAKSSLIMQQESTLARSSSIARDWFHLGRVTTLDEVRGKIEALTVDSVMSYVHEHPAREFTILTIGPRPLEVSL